MIPRDELDRLTAAVNRATSLHRIPSSEDAETELVAGLQRVEKLIYESLVAGELQDWMPELLRLWLAALAQFRDANGAGTGG